MSYQIIEYETFPPKDPPKGLPKDPKKDFLLLVDFIHENTISDDGEAVQCMKLTTRKGKGIVAQACNYVGVISLSNGTTIEILPKIWDGSNVETADQAKEALLRMVAAVRGSRFSSFQSSRIDTKKRTILEIYIRMFLDEVLLLARRGLRCGYVVQEDNVPFFKGKMLFPGQIRYNLAHKERCYCVYDEFTANRAENRLLKSTLRLLKHTAAGIDTQKDICTLLGLFDGINTSKNIDADFACCTHERGMREYRSALAWSKVFLQGKSFAIYSKPTAPGAKAYLFPMNKIFEDYIAVMAKKVFSGCTVNIQSTEKRLFDTPKRFALRPDIVIKNIDINQSNTKACIIDTKWKLLNGNAAKDYGVSSADMYQMFAYSKKYNIPDVILLYPRTNDFPPNEESPKPYTSEDKDTKEITRVWIRAVDVSSQEKTKEGLKSIYEELKNTW